MNEKTEKVLKELEEKSGLSQNELMKRIKEKQIAFADMLTIKGAAHLVANDLGIKLTNEKLKRLEMKNIVAGMRNVNTVGKIFKISRVVEFNHGGRPGKVVNLFISDGTAYVRLPLWNDQVKLVEDEEINVGDIVQIINAMAREGMFGIELNLGKYGRIVLLEEEEIEFPDVKELISHYLSPDARLERIAIKNATPGNFETRAFIVQIFKGNFIFNICPECGGKVEEQDGKYVCAIHAEIEPEPALVVSAIADDGSGSIRVTFFRSVAEQLGISTKELIELDKNERYKIIAEKILGREFILQGRIRKNQRFKRLEMIVNEVKQINISEETEKLIGIVEQNLG